MSTPFKVLAIRLTTNVGTFAGEMGSAGVVVKKFGETANTAATSHKLLGAAVVTSGALIVGALSGAVKAAADFEKQMRNVNSITGLGEQAFKAQSAAVIALSRSLPQSASTLAAGLYDIASSGFQGADGLTVLKAAATAASAGLTDTTTSARAIVGVLNAYGLTAKDAADVSDTLFQTVNVGVVTFGELASSIGDVVPLASAAGVSIDQVGSAIAAMTLSGISGQEAATSLSRIIQQLVKPTAAMSLVLKQLGYDSGATALQQDGLRTVMERLGQATGGTVSGLLDLFSDIRAARGAFALLANEGENYDRVAGQIEDTTKRGGITQRVLNEQLKSFAGQMSLLRNQITDLAIPLGQALIPQLLRLRDAAEEGGQRALPLLLDIAHRLSPAFGALEDSGRNLVTILGHLWSAVGPVVTALAALAGGSVIASLSALATALSGVTGFLADHQTLVLALATVYTATFVPAIGRAVVAIGTQFLEAIDSGIERLGVYTATLDAATVSTLATKAATTGLTALVIYELVKGFTSGTKAVEDFKKTVTGPYDTTSLDGISGALQMLDVQTQITQDKLNKRLNSIGASVEDLFGSDKTTNLQNQMESVAGLRNNLQQSRANIVENISAIGRQSHLSADEVEALAKKAGVDLSQSFDKSGAARAKVIDSITKIGAASGLSLQQLVKMGAGSVEQMQAVADAVESATKKASDALATSSDVISKFDPKLYASGLDDIAAAQQGVDEATKTVADATQNLNRQLSDPASKTNTQQIADAREQVATATDKLTVAQQKLTNARGALTTDPQQLIKLYRDELSAARSFVQNVRDATNQGLNPQFIARLLEQGPEKAGPILQTIVSDHTGRLVTMVNDSEKALEAINTKVVSITRLTALAVASSTDQMARDLGEAMDVTLANLDQGADASVASIAKATGLSEDEVKRVAREFGITIAGMQGTVDNFGVKAAGAFDGTKTSIDKAGTALDGFKVKLDDFAKTGTPTIDNILKFPGVMPGGAGLIGPPVPPPVQHSIAGRWGGVVRFAAGGISAGVTRAPTILFGERETGGEAFIPRLGNRARSMGVLHTAANWLGARVTPMANGGINEPPGSVMLGRRSGMSSGGWGGGMAPADIIRLVKAATPITVNPPPTVDANQIIRAAEWHRGY